MASVRLLPQAGIEVAAAFDWYLERSESAAEGFLRELERSLALVAQTPLVWPEFERGTRRYLMRRYPFSIIYRHSHDLVEVIALAHQRREPGYWRQR